MTKAAIIGGGVIGGGWAARFLLNGWDVVVYDPDPEAERKIEAVLERARLALPMLYERALPAAGRLSFAPGIAAAVEGAAYIQESVPERLDLKHRVYQEIAAATDTPIGSSTSGFKPSDLGEGSATPGQVYVAHPFVPVYLLPLVEIVAHPAANPAQIDAVSATLRGIGMHPLRVRAEIDAHIADRLLEAVWREALWLVKDGIASTGEIDDAIRYGFGLRWAQMGLFETYRIGGGEKGMAHFLAQFGPALKWPWTKLMDVPDLDDALVARVAGQSDAQSGHLAIAELETLRDRNLVAILRALKAQGTAAGRLIAAHEARLPPPAAAADGPSPAAAAAPAPQAQASRPQPQAEATPLVTVDRTVPHDWTDYNGHMNESRFGQAFSDAADAVMAAIGADAGYIADKLSYFTVDIRIRFLAEAQAGELIRVLSQVLEGEGKKLRLFHRMLRADGTEMATAEQLLIHVSLETRRACPPREDVAARLAALAAAHAALPAPEPNARLSRE